MTVHAKYGLKRIYLVLLVYRRYIYILVILTNHNITNKKYRNNYFKSFAKHYFHFHDIIKENCIQTTLPTTQKPSPLYIIIHKPCKQNKRNLAKKKLFIKKQMHTKKDTVEAFIVTKRKNDTKLECIKNSCVRRRRDPSKSIHENK